jgi:hypothetical protein
VPQPGCSGGGIGESFGQKETKNGERKGPDKDREERRRETASVSLRAPLLWHRREGSLESLEGGFIKEDEQYPLERGLTVEVFSHLP